MQPAVETKEKSVVTTSDPEIAEGTTATTATETGAAAADIEAPPSSSRVRRWIRAIGAEEGGIERVPEWMRTDQSPRDLFSVFFAANCNTASLALGYLGPAAFQMGWWDSFAAILLFNLAGAALPALAARLGPKLGLRTMTIPRYSFGWWPAKVLALLSAINQIGWAIVNAISGAGVLYDAGDGDLPLAAAVVVVAVVAIGLGLMGYHVVHVYMRWSFYLVFVCFVIMAGFGAGHFVNVAMPSGPLEASSVLSFGTAIIGYEIAWQVVAADYGVYMRETVSGSRSSAWMFFGLIIPQITIEWLGAAVGTLSRSPDPRFAAAYASRGIGGLIGAVFDGRGSAVRGLGKFVEVVLSMSTMAVITANIYSLGLSVQIISNRLMAVPRFVWCLAGSAVFLACSIAGRDHLEAVMENFLLICAYWIMPFAVIVMTEHFVWRRAYQYDLDAWNDPSKLPYGIAASVSWVVGTVISILSMSQEWWVGPIASGIGGSEAGTDISWILAFFICPIIYVPLRIWERRKWGL
ncbi:nucleobase:cation symporter-1, NCS1 family [Geosmithia morbida]|uniref:Nucleobase:cation symporter-1, NCS1 family n=1 Tax=Geosmithia morbida TaxID=1094350 RepID=A0A9P5D289_9HYPO|nr:nucleobase:cation symporter-1, NCS1 family [Geosmithia morbida]KAF4119269.1 nucleobase:cation symporter-1, NCS1 family [Geosmithia morbida]